MDNFVKAEEARGRLPHSLCKPAVWFKIQARAESKSFGPKRALLIHLSRSINQSISQCKLHKFCTCSRSGASRRVIYSRPPSCNLSLPILLAGQHEVWIDFCFARRVPWQKSASALLCGRTFGLHISNLEWQLQLETRGFPQQAVRARSAGHAATGWKVAPDAFCMLGSAYQAQAARLCLLQERRKALAVLSNDQQEAGAGQCLSAIVGNSHLDLLK